MDTPIDESVMRRELLIAFEYSYLHDDWVNPLSEALDGVTVSEALWSPYLDAKCIWEIVLHVAVWAENIVARREQRRRGDPPGRPSEGAWPALPDTDDETAWASDQQRLWDALAAVRTYIETTPLVEMLDYGNAGYSQFDDLLCRFFHNAYHLGQITKLREFYALQSKQ